MTLTGARGAAGRTVLRLGAEARALRRTPEIRTVVDALRGATALEPGGPSQIFGRLGEVPVYRALGALDTLDYAETTLWSGGLKDRPRVRRRMIGEAGHLSDIDADVYDAVLASHVLEHLANPLGALAEWQRVVRPEGHVLLVLPHRDATFDHRRPVTTIEHLRADAAAEMAEDDLTHLEEVLALHDLARDPGAPDPETFERRCRENPSMRGMHHHVFDSLAVLRLCREAELEVRALVPREPFHIVCLCRVGGDPRRGLEEVAAGSVLAGSPFPSDRAAALSL